MKLYYMEVDGLTVYIEVKNVKGMRLRVNERGVFLSVRPGVMPDDCRAFVRTNREWIDKHLVKIQTRRDSRPELTREQVFRFIKDFKPRFEQWQKRMGLPTAKLTFRYMTSRWGSCNHVTRSITFNTRLAQYPPECTDYVIVHELAHLVHPNHSVAFWALVAEYIPDWKALRSRLRE